jgi:hypothetical protein
MNKEQLSRVLCLFSCFLYLMGNKKNKETLSRFKSILDFPDARRNDIRTACIRILDAACVLISLAPLVP